MPMNLKSDDQQFIDINIQTGDEIKIKAAKVAEFITGNYQFA